MKVIYSNSIHRINVRGLANSSLLVDLQALTAQYLLQPRKRNKMESDADILQLLHLSNGSALFRKLTRDLMVTAYRTSLSLSIGEALFILHCLDQSELGSVVKLRGLIHQTLLGKV